jgi:hypothetical protein
MMQPLKLLSIVPTIIIFFSPSGLGQAIPSKVELEARITLLTEQLHEGDHFKITAEVENISDHPVLVWKDLSSTSSLPGYFAVFLEDSAGHQILLSFMGEALILELPDLQIENGILRWRVPLYPRMFIGTHLNLNLSGISPGKYRLHGRYVVGRPRHKVSDLERALLASKFSIFEGVVETNSIQVEILPKEGQVAQTIDSGFLTTGNFAGCHLEDRVVCGPKNLTCCAVRDSKVEILRSSKKSRGSG